jgi:hypothetical protein
VVAGVGEHGGLHQANITNPENCNIHMTGPNMRFESISAFPLNQEQALRSPFHRDEGLYWFLFR